MTSISIFPPAQTGKFGVEAAARAATEEARRVKALVSTCLNLLGVGVIKLVIGPP